MEGAGVSGPRHSPTEVHPVPLWGRAGWPLRARGPLCPPARPRLSHGLARGSVSTPQRDPNPCTPARPSLPAHPQTARSPFPNGEQAAGAGQTRDFGDTVRAVAGGQAAWRELVSPSQELLSWFGDQSWARPGRSCHQRALLPRVCGGRAFMPLQLGTRTPEAGPCALSRC